MLIKQEHTGKLARFAETRLRGKTIPIWDLHGVADQYPDRDVFPGTLGMLLEYDYEWAHILLDGVIVYTRIECIEILERDEYGNYNANK